MIKITSNKKGYYDYTIVDDYQAGIVLLGSEVKSIRNKQSSIREAYCHIDNGEMWIKGMYIGEYKESGKYQNHETIRDRKLLLNKREIKKLQEKVSQKGMTIIPLDVYINDKGLIKLHIALATGKKLYDKKETIKARDIDRDTNRQLKD